MVTGNSKSTSTTLTLYAIITLYLISCVFAQDSNQTSIMNINPNGGQTSNVPSSRERSSQQPDVPSSRECSSQQPDVPNSRERSSQQPDVPNSRERSSQQPDVPNSRERSSQQPDVPNSRERSSQQPDVPNSRECSSQQPDVPSSRECSSQQPDVPSSRECSSQQPDVPSSRERSSQQPDVPSSRERSSQQPDVPSSRECSSQQPDVPNSRERSSQQPDVPNSRECSSQQPDVPSSRERSSQQLYLHQLKRPDYNGQYKKSYYATEPDEQRKTRLRKMREYARLQRLKKKQEQRNKIMFSTSDNQSISPALDRTWEVDNINIVKPVPNCLVGNLNTNNSPNANSCKQPDVPSSSAQNNQQNNVSSKYMKLYCTTEPDEQREKRLQKKREYARLQRLKKKQEQHKKIMCSMTDNQSRSLALDHTREVDNINTVKTVPNCLVGNLNTNNSPNTYVYIEKDIHDQLPDRHERNNKCISLSSEHTEAMVIDSTHTVQTIGNFSIDADGKKNTTAYVDNILHNSNISIDTTIYPPFYAGRMTKLCEFCNAFRFPTEALNCCHNGKVTLIEDEYSPELLELFSRRNFLNDIRVYNSAFAFASLGAQIKQPPGRGPYCFRIHGQIYHRTGTLHPAQGQRPAYGQVYILEANEAVQTHKARNPQLNEEILQKIFTVLSQINPFAAALNHMHEVEQNESQKAHNTGHPPSVIKMVIKEGRDPRRYNAPLHDEVAAVFVGEDGAPSGNHDIVIYPRNQPLQHISYMNANCDAMMYPLLFPSGQIGWHSKLQHNIIRQTRVRNKVTQLQYYSYRLAIRPGVAALHQAGKLFHQYLVDAYVKTEAERLLYIRTHQSHLRAEKYKGLLDHVHNKANAHGLPPGKIVILPSTFPGSPRAMQQNFQDAMAMVTTFGRPDIFLTFTCNPRTKEIIENLLPGQQPQDRPDIISRVFHQHLSELLQDIKCTDILGKIIANIHVIEFQKRGLPHAHLLIWLAEENKLRTAEDIDTLICAEIPDRATQPVLHEIIVTNNIHGPCGILNPECVCMKDGTCSKNFPKKFNKETNICLDGYPNYRRRNNGTKAHVRGFQLDNRWVVPYNPQLSIKYRAHINVEACMSIKCVKYLFKYVYKGHDCASVELTEQVAYNHDEVKTYCDARYVSAPEAMWRLSEYHMSEKSHCIIRLPVHLPHEQQVFFTPGEEAEAMDRSESHLTAWFKLNTESEDARRHLYTEIPKHYTYNKKRWNVRKRGSSKIIVRMYSVSPVERERFCLRLLLLHIPGAMTFDDLKKYNDEIFSTFSEACLARGLLSDDRQWDNALSEAATLNMPKQCRQLFVSLLTHCHPNDPLQLWLNHKESLAEDYCRNLQLETDQAIQHALSDINDRLAQFGFSCASFNLPTAAINVTPEELDLENELRIAEHNISILNPEQSAVVCRILEHVDCDKEIIDPRAYFLDGPGGTGKTLVYNTLIAAVRSRGKQVAACAWTGIAAILLNGGVTVHNLFKLPVPVLDNSVCNVRPASTQGRLLQQLDLILIDEASMIPNHALNAIDCLLQDIMRCKIPFGGKLILFGGDFRQVLPVVPRASPAGIVEQCLKRSQKWKLIKKFHLITNMRALESERSFAAWLLQLGNGDLKSTTKTAAETCIDIPIACSENIIDAIFPDFNQDRTRSVILTPKNDTSLQLSDNILQRLAGHEYKFYSHDCVLTDDEEEAQQYPPEFLHSITPSGMPPHVIKLKIGATVMLLRNLDTKRGLCNGVRLKIINIHSYVLEAEIITGSHIGNKVLIPKLKLAPSDVNLPFILQRCQFPVRLSYVMTINKSQGQTFDKVGIYLPKPVFSHGQLYVAFSRARALSDISVCVVPGDEQEKIGDIYVTPNVVFKEVL